MAGIRVEISSAVSASAVSTSNCGAGSSAFIVPAPVRSPGHGVLVVRTHVDQKYCVRVAPVDAPVVVPSTAPGPFDSSADPMSVPMRSSSPTAPSHVNGVLIAAPVVYLQVES